MRKIKFILKEQVCPATGEEFIPNRENQIYINRAVQIKHNNDRAKLKRKDLKDLNDRIISNQKKLEKLYNYLKKNNSKSIHAEFVKFEGVDFHTYTKISKNPNTGGRICWSLDYGIEALEEKMTHFYIHKKNK
jgi:hypothetical protein